MRNLSQFSLLSSMGVCATNIVSPSGSISKFRRKCFQLRRSTPISSHPLPAFWLTFSPAGFLPLVSPLLSRNPYFQDTRATSLGEWADLEEEDDEEDEFYPELVVETCMTRVLPQALTLEYGLEALRDAINELKLNPPTTSSGLIRIEVAVPLASKAFNWFYSQPESPEVFPQFYISKESEIPTHQSVYLNNIHGIYGIGAAIDFRKTSSGSIGNWSSFRRYLMVESTNVTAYGFIGSNCKFESSFMKLDSGSFYFIIPQIELNEYEGNSLLAGTIAWDEASFCSFWEALSSFQISLIQACRLFSASVTCNRNFVKSKLKKFNVVGNEMTQLVYMDSLSLSHSRRFAVSVEMVSPSF